jgi:hypothetical protein
MWSSSQSPFFKHFVATFSTSVTASKMRLQVNASPALLTQGQDILNRALLLLPACIREGFCDGPLRKIEHVGKTERYEIAGQTSEISDPFVEKRFHLA